MSKCSAQSSGKCSPQINVFCKLCVFFLVLDCRNPPFALMASSLFPLKSSFDGKLWIFPSCNLNLCIQWYHRYDPFCTIYVESNNLQCTFNNLLIIYLWLNKVETLSLHQRLNEWIDTIVCSVDKPTTPSIVSTFPYPDPRGTFCSIWIWINLF